MHQQEISNDGAPQYECQGMSNLPGPFTLWRTVELLCDLWNLKQDLQEVNAVEDIILYIYIYIHLEV